MPLTPEQFESLTEDEQKVFVKSDDGYIVSPPVVEEPSGELVRALERLKAKEKAHADENKTLKDRLDKIGADAARKAGDIETLEKSWKEKSEAEKNELLEQHAKLKTSVAKTLVQDKASLLAAKLAVKPEHAELLAPWIEKRLAPDLEQMTTRVLDTSGQISAMTLDDLAKEIREDARYAPLVVGIRGSNGKEGSPTFVPSGHTDLSKMSSPERIAHIKTLRNRS